jgi:hypothetical protein
MFEPNSGRLAYGNGRIAAIFGHKNYFGSQGFHQSDTMLSFSETKPNDVKLAWGDVGYSGHSLVQRMIFDGTSFVSAALGDAYPEGLMFNVIESGKAQKGKFLRHVNKGGLVKMAGNFGGYTAGQLGDVMLLKASPPTYGVTYSRWSAKFPSGQTRNSINELGFIKLNNKLKSLGQKTVIAQNNIVNVASSKYGNNIVIVFVEQLPAEGGSYQYPQYPSYRGDESTLKQRLVVINQNGNKVGAPVDLAGLSLNPSEGLYPLKNGAVVWSFVTSNGGLVLSYLPAPGAC